MLFKVTLNSVVGGHELRVKWDVFNFHGTFSQPWNKFPLKLKRKLIKTSLLDLQYQITNDHKCRVNTEKKNCRKHKIGSFSSRDKSVVLTGETKGDILQGPKLEKRAPWRLRKFQKAISFCPSALSRPRKHLIFIHRSIIQAAGKLMHVIAERQFKRTILGAKLFFFK